MQKIGRKQVVYMSSSADLKTYFDQVWVVTLKRRPDRLDRFWSELQRVRWPFAEPRVYEAVDGAKLDIPNFWQTGSGSYGCLRSHFNILERAILDGVGSILILEDDAVLQAEFSRQIQGFLATVPSDWQCLMLGGQHVNCLPEPIVPGMVGPGKGGGGIQRTHCYALRGEDVMKALYKAWGNAAVHCDWVMGPLMQKFHTYAPNPFLVGQGDGASDISGGFNPAKFWRSPTGFEPVVVLHTDRPVMEQLRGRGLHSGHTRDAETGIDVGLRDIFADASLSEDERREKLKSWVHMIQWEVVSMPQPAVCTVWHPKARADMFQSWVQGAVVEVAAQSVEEALGKCPLKMTSSRSGQQIPVVLLKAPRGVMEALRSHGLHTGYWRDELTGQDNGLRQIFASITDRWAQRHAVETVIRTLHDEASVIPNGIATIWHPQVTSDMIDTELFLTTELVAEKVEEAVSKLVSRQKDFRKPALAAG